MEIARGLRWEATVITALVFVEMAALITAAGSNNPVLNWLAGRPGAVGVGVLLVLVGQLYIDSIAEAYRVKGTLTHDQAASIERLARVLLRWSIAVAIVAVILFYTKIW
ncbi:hypothetical protein HW130_17355 [Streptomyces sp. PKU-EA00015]|uniref:hypothetical protein n=1 Tax=Streptomyces sp. PKU-EA00015 TaxID=2748326 RepID=UPI0015A0CEDB|nr:hypothetical protein [Streptomyces sp. PKU-EA00015]NWF28012.1 hypothetical protein [Streptomyces sp. PKU-EA00015]